MADNLQLQLKAACAMTLLALLGMVLPTLARVTLFVSVTVWYVILECKLKCVHNELCTMLSDLRPAARSLAACRNVSTKLRLEKAERESRELFALELSDRS